ncbi:unnamed protein product [Bemisia tabaci]|uniref:Uncharacterized protein n=1 Tax=Bemisia tabaci TaxID=7038 RepID=A0A9P0EX01_BEMTA|nr:unnamed protein product [Bemisia tabaci]
MFYTRNPPTWRGHDPSTVYLTPEIIPPFTQRPITKSVPTVVSSTIQDATGDLRRILWQPSLFEDVRNDVNHRRTRFYNRSNRPQSRLYVKEDTISKEGATDSEGVVIGGSSIEAAKPEIEEFVRLSTRSKKRKRLPKVRTTSEVSFIDRNS